jgi:hypothetical protein
MDIAGHVSRQMLRHYSHIRMQAKREALEAVLQKQQATAKKKEPEQAQPCPPIVPVSNALERGVPTNSPTWVAKGGSKGMSVRF